MAAEDRLGALERLQRLRDSGALSEAEFHREKEALLNAPSHPSPGAAPPGATSTEINVARSGTPAWVWVLVGVFALALIGGAAWFLLASDDRDSDRSRVERRERPDRAANDEEEEKEERREPSIRDRPEAEQLAVAFQAAFGDRTTRKLETGDARFQPGRLVWIGDTAALVSPGTIPDACHGCYGSIAIHYLRPTADGFEVTGEWLDRAGGSSYGSPGEPWRIDTRLSTHPVVYAESGFSGQGYTCTVATMTELRPGEPIESDGVPIHMDNEGAVMDDTGTTSGGDPVRNVDGEIVDVQKGRGFTVRFTGTEQFEEKYVYRGGRFVRAGGESRATC